MRSKKGIGVALMAATALIGAAVLAVERPATEPRETTVRTAPIKEDAAGRVDVTSPGAAGLRVYLDPETGRIIDRPTDAEAISALRDQGERFSTYGRDLLEEPLAGGGFKVDLRGRFQSSVVATIDPFTDQVTIDCVTSSARPEVADER